MSAPGLSLQGLDTLRRLRLGKQAVEWLPRFFRQGPQQRCLTFRHGCITGDPFGMLGRVVDALCGPRSVPCSFLPVIHVVRLSSAMLYRRAPKVFEDTP